MIHPPQFLRRCPGLREPLRRAAKRLAPRGPVRVSVGGLDWTLDPADNKVDFDIWYKRRLGEEIERDFLAAHLCPGDVFVDVGANIGLYPLSLMRRVHGLRVITFEPITRLRTRQLKNLAANGLSGHADVRAEAVGPAGTATIYESTNSGASSLLPRSCAQATHLVTTVPLLDALGGVAPAALKVDVEGFEAEALMPYFDAAPRASWPRAIVIETLHRAVWPRDCLQELLQRGYVEKGRTQENALLARSA